MLGARIGTAADIERFNRQLRELLLGSKGLLAGWLDAQTLLQEAHGRDIDLQMSKYRHDS